MSVSIDALEIKIASDSTQAAKGIDNLITSLKNLRDSCTGGAGLSEVANGLRELNNELKKFNANKAKKTLDGMSQSANTASESFSSMVQVGTTVQSSFDTMAASAEKAQSKLNDLIQTTSSFMQVKWGFNRLEGGSSPVAGLLGGKESTINGDGLWREVAYDLPATQFDDLREKIGGMKTDSDKATNALVKVDDELKRKPKDARGASRAFKQVGDSARKSGGGLGYFLSSLKRIVMYRAIYAGMKAIEDGLREGLSNAYQFARIMNLDVAKSMDSVASHSYRMKNQIGALSAQFIQTIAPMLIRLADMVNEIANRFTEIFAAMNGEQKYMKANLVAKTWEDAKESLNDYKKQLSGLDELNNISPNSQMPQFDYKDLYTMEKVSNNLKWLKNVKLALDDITVDVMDVLWDIIGNSDKSGNLLCKKIGAFIGAGLGFKYGGVGGAITGAIAGVVITSIIEDFLFDKKGKKTKKAVGTSVADVLTGLAGGVIGFEYGGIGGALVGATLGASLSATVSTLVFDKDKSAKYKAKTIYNKIAPILGGALGAAMGYVYGGAGGALIGLTAGTALSLMISSLKPENALSEGDRQQTVDNMAKIMGGAIGAIIGLATTGSFKGGVFGFTIGASITLDIIEIITNWDNKLTGLEDNIVGWINEKTGLKFSTATERKEAKYDYINDQFGSIVDDYRKKFGNDTAFNQIIGNIANAYNMPMKTSYDILEIIQKAKSMGVKGFASGGYVTGGHLFFANENGNPEYIGNMGGTTAVANSGQMEEAIEAASYRGMARALQQYGNNGSDSNYEPMSGDDVFVFLRKKANSYTQRTGNPAFN